MSAQISTRDIKRYCVVKEEADNPLEAAINKLELSARAYSRLLKVSRTIADLAGSEVWIGDSRIAIDTRSIVRRWNKR